MKKQKINFFKLRLISIFLLIPLFAVGCGGGSSKKLDVSLVVWQPFTAREVLQPIIQEFERNNRGVKVELVDKSIGGYEEGLLDSLASGSGPDIFAINNAWVPEYMDKIQPADSTLWPLVDYQNAFVDVLSSDLVKDGQIYGTALSVDTLALYYNKAILGDNGVFTPPATWSDFQKAVRQITRQESSGYFVRSGVAMGHSSVSAGGAVNRAEDVLYLLSLQLGGTSFRPDGAGVLFGSTVRRGGRSLVPMVEALGFYTSFADSNTPNYNWNSLSDYSIDAFSSGRAAMMLNYAYTRDLIKAKNPRLDFGIASAPQQDLENPAINFANYWALSVNKQSENSKWAWKFLQFITEKENLEKYVQETKQPASRKDILISQSADPELSVFARGAATAKSFFRPHSKEMDKVFAGTIDSVIFQGLSPQSAVGQAARQAQAIIQRKN